MKRIIKWLTQNFDTTIYEVYEREKNKKIEKKYRQTVAKVL